jgi:DNA repair photolyase
MIREIRAKTLLASVKEDPLFGLKYNLNLYRGCEHQCIYCDSRSECYGIENFKDVLVKVNALDLLEKELRSKRVKGPIGTGSMNDPYAPVELRYNLTGQALTIIARYGFPVHIVTKSDLILKDLETLVQINRVHAAVCFTITTPDDTLAKKLEPGAPPSSARLKAMQLLAGRGIPVGVSLMPVLPWFGMSLRDRQREYFYTQLDRLFPGMRQCYERCFGNRYECPTDNARQLYMLMGSLCARLDLSNHTPRYQPEAPVRQMTLF